MPLAYVLLDSKRGSCTLRQIVQHSHSLRFRDQVQVIQECKQFLVRIQSSLHCFKGCMLANTEEQWHQRVALLSPLSLVNRVSHAFIIFPELLGRR